MREEVRQVMDLTIEGIIKDEGYARELAEAAYWTEQDGHRAIAEDMRHVGRQYRIRGMKKRARLALLQRAYPDG
ncbi:hypothetical protein AKJ13_27090 [Methylobacterium sp. ARG-1]|nr:hypothetical protein AKJ13_27090 [Methylobacterium sp. ARG-1]